MTLFGPAVETLEDRTLLSSPTVTALNPAANSHTAALGTDIAATFDQAIDGSTVSDQTFVVRAMQSRRLLTANGDITSLTTSGATVTLDPANNFHAGEFVQVTATAGIENAGSEAAVPHVWQFRTKVGGGSGLFGDSGQSLGGSSTRFTSLGDLDGDGDLDAFVANFGQANRVWLNDGSGIFTGTGQALGSSDSSGVSLGDVDGDGDLDAFVANARNQADRVWLNDGSGTFSIGQTLGASDGRRVSLGDLDGDGDLDAFVVNNGPNRVWLNDGSGSFIDSGQTLGSDRGAGLSLGDLDGDGDLDAFVVNDAQPQRVWLNNGSGIFTIGQSMASFPSRNVSLGDLDGDGDLDAFVVNDVQPHRVWLNDGSGIFIDTGQTLGSSASLGVSVGDLDGDGDLDAFVSNVNAQGNRVWLNDGSGTFTDSGQTLGNSQSEGVTLGDLNGDGDLDAFVGNDTGQANRVWLNEIWNLPPVANANGPYTVAEGSATALDGSNSTDPDDGIADYEWDFNYDGATFDVDAIGPMPLFDAASLDGPSTRTVALRVRDTMGAESDIVTTTVEVNNVAPTLVLDPVAPIDENGTATLTGTISDPGTLDTFTLDINWGDPLSPNNTETYTFGASATGSQTFTLTHQYLDDHPSGTSQDIDTLSVTLSDDDGGVDSDGVTLLTWNQQAKLTASDGAPSDFFGGGAESGAVAVSGDTLVVGAHGNDDSGSNSGSAYVYVRSGTSWNEQAKLTASDAAAGDFFGSAVAIFGDTIVVGAFRNDDAGTDSGSVYVFQRNGAIWTEQAKLTASDAAAGDWFGSTVAIVGGTLAVGAQHHAGTGAAYVYQRSGTTWSEQAKLTASDAAPGDFFGKRVGVDGDTVVVGAAAENGTGSAYVYQRTGATWTEQAKLTASDAAAGDSFGFSVAVSGDTALIGARDDDDGGPQSGSAYVFQRSGATWSQQAKLTASDAAADDQFGLLVSLSGDRAVIGAPTNDDAGSNSGSAYVFQRSGTAWTQETKLTANDAAASDIFGESLAVSGDTIAVGAHLDDDNGTNSGSAYVFVLEPTGSEPASTVTVKNVAPTLVLDPVAMIDENGTATLTGTISDPGTLDTFTLDINWGDPLSPNNTETYTFGASATGSQTFTLTHQYLDDNPSGTSQDTYTIGVTVTDDDTGSVTAATTVEVSNVDPEIADFHSSSPSCGGAGEGDEVTISADFSDVGTLDTHTATIDWGDGTTSSGIVVESGGSGSVSGTHAYEYGGVYTATLTLTDDDTGEAVAAAPAVITGVGLNNGVLQIVGTEQNDHVTVTLTGVDDGDSEGGSEGGDDEDGGPAQPQFKVHANFLPAVRGGSDGESDGEDDDHDGHGHGYRVFDAAEITSILIILCDGNDHATIAGNITVDSIIDGGPGNDELKGGGGSDVLLGGDGRDELDGGSDHRRGQNRDILIGGRGADELEGDRGEDLLIAGWTEFDGVEDDLTALLQIQAEWVSTERDFTTRVENISGTGSGPRENDMYFLQSGSTVFNDGDRDEVDGGKDQDWLFADTGEDKVKIGKGDLLSELLTI